MFDLKICEQVNHFNGHTWFELFDIESGEVLHEGNDKQECIDHFNTLDHEKYELLYD